MVQNWPRNLFLTCWKFSDFSTFLGVAPRSSGQGRSDLRIHSLSFTRKKASRKPQAAHRSENLKFYMCFLRFSDRCADRSAQEFYWVYFNLITLYFQIVANVSKATKKAQSTNPSATLLHSFNENWDDNSKCCGLTRTLDETYSDCFFNRTSKKPRDHDLQIQIPALYI